MCIKTFWPVSIKSFGTTHPAYPLLQKGYEVNVNGDGFVVDAWNPRDNVLVNAEGETVGTRENSFQYEDAPEYFEDHRNTFTEADKGRFRTDSKEYELLNMGLEITLDKYGTLLEIRNPVTKKLLDFDLNDIGELEFVAIPDGYTKLIKNPLRVTYTIEDRGEFTEGGDMDNALTQSPDMQVTLDDKGFIIDIWDSKTGKLYDIHGGDLGTRSDPYPSDNNIGSLKALARDLETRINALRRQLRGEKGAARAATNAQLLGLLRERGRALWLFGRLMNRKRRMDEAYNKRRTKGTKAE